MKRITAILLAVFIIGGIFQTSFAASATSNSSVNTKKLIDCLSKTQKADSMEADVITNTTTQGQAIGINMNMKMENIKKGLKSVITLDMPGLKQQMYFSIANGKAVIYTKDAAGKYTATPVDSSQAGDMDVTRSFSAYINIFKKNPSMITKVNNNKFRLTIPKNKITDFYTNITGKDLNVPFSSMTIDFGIGSDGYLQTVVLNTNYNSVKLSVTTKYYNYNKKFNIVLPSAS